MQGAEVLGQRDSQMHAPLVEYIVLDAQAKSNGSFKWAQRLGQRLPAVRALLRPPTRAAFANWDPGAGR